MLRASQRISAAALAWTVQLLLWAGGTGTVREIESERQIKLCVSACGSAEVMSPEAE